VSDRLTLETMFCDPRFFGVTTATPVQRAMCRIAEGLPLAELVSCDDVRQAVGGEEALAILAPGNFRPRELDILGPVRGGKSVFVASHGCWSALSVNLDSLRSDGEIARHAVLSVNLRSAQATFNHLVGAMLSRPLLKSLLVGDVGAESLFIRHPSGRVVEVTVVAGARAGANLVSVWLTGVAFEEYPRQAGEGEGAVVNFDDQLRTAAARVLEGGQILSAGAPWAPFGPAFERFRESFGRPSPDRVVLRATGPMMNPTWYTPARVAQIRRTNPQAHKTDVLAEFADGEMTVFPSEDLERAYVLDAPANCEPGEFILSVDLSAMRHDSTAVSAWRWLIPPSGSPHLWVSPRAADGSLIRDAYPLRDEDGALVPNPDFARIPPVFECVHIEGWDPGSRARRVTAREVADRLVELCHHFGARVIAADQYEQFTMTGLIADRDSAIQYRPFDWTSKSKGPAVDRARALIVSGQMRLPANHPKLREEMSRFRRRLTQTGESFVVPGAGHGDYASCVVTACMADLAGLCSYSPLARRANLCTETDEYTGEVRTF
jgi:hypothetical protein